MVRSMYCVSVVRSIFQRLGERQIDVSSPCDIRELSIPLPKDAETNRNKHHGSSQSALDVWGRKEGNTCVIPRDGF